MAEQKDVFFVGVREPIEVRKEVLGCTKDVIGELKRHEKFKEVRKEKAETVVKFKKLIDEINLLNNKLKQELPKTKLRALAKERAEIEEVGISIREERPVRKRTTTALDKLEQELMQLESKLGRLK